jgi:hypothetical protein
MATKPGDHSQSSYGRDYWLRRCQGFRVDGPEGRIGRVRGVRLGRSAEPEALEVQAGLLGRRTLLIPVTEVAEVIPEQRSLILCRCPRLFGSEPLED